MATDERGGMKLTVILRRDAPMMFCGDSPSYRSVQIELTPEQIKRIGIQVDYKSGGKTVYEDISKCFIEPKPQIGD